MNFQCLLQFVWAAENKLFNLDKLIIQGMMKKMKKPFYGIAFLSVMISCSTSQELSNLEEYDDLYYTPTTRDVQTETYPLEEFVGASSAENSYYGESPYVDDSEKPSTEFADVKAEEEDYDEDYYDPEYARRIENFHRDEDPHYVYSDAFQNNMNPRFYANMNFNSFNGFNSTGFGFGMSFGNPMYGSRGFGNPWMGNRWCDPFFDPFCNCGRPGFGPSFGWGATWGMYDPFNPWYSTSNFWGNPWMNPYNNPYVWNNPWGPTVIVVDGNGSGRGFRNTSRSSNGNNRTSRGGVAGNAGSRSGRSAGVSDGAKANGSTRSSRTNVERTRTSRNIDAQDYFDTTNRRSQTRTATQKSENARRDFSRSRRQAQAPSPYARQRARQNSSSSASDYSRHNRNNSRKSSSTTKSRTNGSFSSPSRSRRNTPSLSTPSRNRSSYSSPSSNPSRRSTGGSSRRR